MACVVARDDTKLEGQEYIIAYKGKPISSIKKTWHKSLERAGITRRIRPYDLRHAFAVAHYRRYRDVYATSRALGHASVNMTAVYQRSLPGITVD